MLLLLRGGEPLIRHLHNCARAR